MSRRTTRRPGRRPAANEHPSIWFFVALGLGLVFIVWMYAHVATKPVPPAKPATATQPKRGDAVRPRFCVEAGALAGPRCSRQNPIASVVQGRRGRRPPHRTT